MTLGIDLGGSTTDVVGFESGNLFSPLSVKASDPVSSAAGSLGRFLVENNRSLSDVSTLAVTGVGSGALGSKLLGLPVRLVDEFVAIGRGGEFLSGLSSVIVASLGTGTAIVEVDNGKISHWGGSGVGGGTLVGLSRALFGMSDIDLIARNAASGNLKKIDLSVGDIASREIPNLPPDTTASNFGKMDEDATVADKAMAVLNLVCQTVGLIAAGAAGARITDSPAEAKSRKTIVLVGKVASLKPATKVFERLSKRFNGMEYRIAPMASFATAVGAAVEVTT